jgi:hypothetical protein
MTSTVALLLATVLSSPADDAEPPGGRFARDDRPVKVVVIAGSIGAYQKDPYHRRLAKVCANIEVENLSKAAIGALAMKKRFRDLVLNNPRLRPKDGDEGEYWVMLGAGINNLYAPESANHHFKNLIVLAHMEGMKVVALSPSPWGSDRSKKHAGLDGLRRKQATHLVTDFLLGRLDARTALGKYADKRPAGADGEWVALERPDIAVDLYDSDLRDRDAALRDADALRAALEKDRAWNRAHEGDDEATRAAALGADAKAAAEVPRWFMKPELRAFDDVHPNTKGHRIIARTTCPLLPERWACDCSAL